MNCLTNHPYNMNNENNKNSSRVQTFIAVSAFVFAVLFGVAGFITPPTGVIDSSVLYLIAQFLLLVCSIFGIASAFSSWNFSYNSKRHV